MIQYIVSSLEPVTLIGAGALGAHDLASALALAPSLVAADGGANLALAAGYSPEAVIGDFDSLPAATQAQIPPERLHHVAEQDSTDFEKTLMRVEAPVILGVGFMGARVDHQLAALHSLLAYAHKPIILLSEEVLILHCPPVLEITVPKQATVSLFPLAPVTGQSEGLEWPIDGIDMAPGHQIGTSNRAVGTHVKITMQSRGMIGLFPRVCLADLVASLLGAPKHALWPALEGQYKDLPQS